MNIFTIQKKRRSREGRAKLEIQMSVQKMSKNEDFLHLTVRVDDITDIMSFLVVFVSG